MLGHLPVLKFIFDVSNAHKITNSPLNGEIQPFPFM